MKRKQLSILGFSILALMLLSVPTLYVAKGADGTTGNFNHDFGQLTDGQTVVIMVEGLTAEADYKINMTGDNTGISFTTGAGQTEFQWQTTVTRGTTDVFYIYLRYQSAGTAIDTMLTTCVEADTVLPTNWFISIAVPILLLSVIAVVAISISRGR